MKTIDNDYNSWDGRMWARRLRGCPELAKMCDWGKMNWEDWMYLLSHCPNTVELVSKCDKWESFPIDRVCDLLREHPQLVAFCPDSVWRKFKLGHWAKLIREQDQNSNYPVIANHEGRWAVVNKMMELGVAVKVDDNHAVVVGGFEWCCLFHWANEYGSVFHRFPAAAFAGRTKEAKELKIKYIAEHSVMNPQGGTPGRYHSDVLKHMQWLAALAADFAAMAAEAAMSAPEYAEEYAIIAQAAEYETRVLKPKSTEFGGWSLSDIVEGRYFRVPDYQRGYAWTNRQLEEFWDDLNDVVESGERHYTGAITVKALTEQAKLMSRDGFEVVDGQQRLTTIAILLSVLKGCDHPFVFNEQGCGHYVFSYGERNDDLQFLLKILSGNESGDAQNSHQRNLKNAQEFFKGKTSDFDEERKNNVVNALMSQLSFDFRDIGSNYSAGMVFETMNNRGKPLTLLEKLKNRLMYLVETLHQDEDEKSIELFEDEKSEARDEIDDTWGRIYRLLAKNPNSDPLDEDVFIAAHLSVYRAPKESVYSRAVAESRLFKMFCHNAERHPKSERIEEGVVDAVARAVKEEAVSLGKIRDYVEDLAEFAEAWSGVHEAYDSALARCRLLSGTQEVKVFLAAVLLHVKDETLHNSICEKAELILFRNTVRSVMDEATFATLARRLHGRCLDMLKKGDNEQIDAQGIESTLREILEDERRQLNVKSVVDYFSDLMSRQHSPYGFYGWRGLKYFLFRQEGSSGLSWNRFDEATLEHVMPQSSAADNDDGWWVRQVQQFVVDVGFGSWDSLSGIDRRACRQCKRNLVNSIGNFVLLTQSENASVSDDPWEEYPEVAGSHRNVIGKKAFYSDPNRISSSGARHIAGVDGSWNAFRIRERGRDLFKNLVADLGAVGSIDEEDIDVALGLAGAPLLENHQFEVLPEGDVNRLAPRLGTAAEARQDSPNGYDVNEANVAFWTAFRSWCNTNNKTWCVAPIHKRGNSYYSPTSEFPLFFTFGKRSGSIRGFGPLVTVGIYCAEGEEQRNKIRAFNDAFDEAFVDCAFDYQDWEYGNGKARRILFIRQADYRNHTSDLFERMANDYERILGVMHANGF